MQEQVKKLLEKSTTLRASYSTNDTMSEGQASSKAVVLELDDSKAWSPISFGDMFTRHLSSPRLEFCVIKVAAGADFSVPALLSRFSAFVLTGSRFNCRDGESLPWFGPLMELIRGVELDDTKRLYGGCFGCQAIAFALGGEVDYNVSGRFILGAETITLATQASPLFPSDKRTVRAIVSHGDCVRALPPNSRLLGSSPSCQNEIFITGRFGNLLACQSHPEFDYDYAIKERIWPAVVEKNKRLSEDEVEAARASFACFAGREEGPDLLMNVIQAFLCREVSISLTED